MATKLPSLSNEGQLKIMAMVKQGISIDEAIKRASELEKQEKQVCPCCGRVSSHAPQNPASDKTDSGADLTRAVRAIDLAASHCTDAGGCDEDGAGRQHHCQGRHPPRRGTQQHQGMFVSSCSC
jgi:hypothetical protein